MTERTRMRERQAARLLRLKRRAIVASTLGFAALFGLAAQHAAGSSKRRVVATMRQAPQAAPARVRFFDEQGDGYAFADPQSVPDAGPASTVNPASMPPPPVAVTSVS